VYYRIRRIPVHDLPCTLEIKAFPVVGRRTLGHHLNFAMGSYSWFGKLLLAISGVAVRSSVSHDWLATPHDR
jgi:hypothetical protein